MGEILITVHTLSWIKFDKQDSKNDKEISKRYFKILFFSLIFNKGFDGLGPYCLNYSQMLLTIRQWQSLAHRDVLQRRHAGAATK